MKIFYQITNHWEKHQVEYLKSHEIFVKEDFDVALIYDYNKYKAVESKLIDWDVIIAIGTEFSKLEIKKSNLTKVSSLWDIGYPIPENEYMEHYYDLSTYCNECGIGSEQIKPFKIKKEPKWGRRNSFMFYWIFDAIFVKKEYYEKHLKSLGIGFIPLIIHKTGDPSETTVQLDIPEVSYDLDLEKYIPEICSKCGRKKYNHIIEGFFPKFKDRPELPIFKSKEYFGSVAAADKAIFVNKELKEILLETKMNFEYYPLED